MTDAELDRGRRYRKKGTDMIAPAEQAPFQDHEKMRADFDRDGFVILSGFFDLESSIEPIQRDIYGVIGRILQRAGIEDHRGPFDPAHFDESYQQIISHDRALGGIIYDAVKQVPSFLRLCTHPSLEQLFKVLRPGSQPGVAAGGYGIRIDNPNEERFRAPWHQEYPSQLRSLNGLVYWSPLVEVTEAIGPVKIAVGSHKAGPIPVYTKDPANPDKAGAYALILKDEEALIAGYEQVASLTRPGDLVVMDFLLLHASGRNVGDRSRWSMQLRYFDFNEPTGTRYGWKGSFASGVDFRTIHPELVLDGTPG